jgi:hypothetical protein
MISNNRSMKVIMRCVEVFVGSGKLAEVKRQIGVNDAARFIYKGLKHLDDKYQLGLDKDGKSSIGYMLTPAAKQSVLRAALEEIQINDQEVDIAEPEPLKDEVKEQALRLISDLHKERLALKEAFGRVNDKILEIERLFRE